MLMSVACLRMMSLEVRLHNLHDCSAHHCVAAADSAGATFCLCVWPGCAGCYLKSAYTAYVTADPSWTTGALITGVDHSRCLSTGMRQNECSLGQCVP